MPKLTYYFAERLDDSVCYSIVTTTLKEAKSQLAQNTHGEYGPIEKKVLVYKNAFDLFTYTGSEGGGLCIGETVKTYGEEA